MSRLKGILIAFLILSVLTTISSLGAYYYWIEPYLPNIASIQKVSLSEPMKIYTRGGLSISEIGTRRRYILTYEEIPNDLIKSLLIIEDARFYKHSGVDYIGLIRSVIAFIKTGQKRQGASTLTMQLARNLFLTREKSFLRKFREIFLAYRLEKVFSKNEILTLYVNRIFLGNRAYGFQAAAQTYYNKKLDQLTLAEIATLSGLPKAPSSYNPVSNPKRAKERRNYILRRLYEAKKISQEVYQKAISEPMISKVYGVPVDVDAGHVGEMARQKATKILRNLGITTGFYEHGYKVITTISGKNQRVANAAVQDRLINYIRRHPWRGVEKTVSFEFHKTAENLQDLKELKNSLIDLTQEIPNIDGLIRGIIYYSEEDKILVLLENGKIFQLPQKDLEWSEKTWTQQTSEYTKLKLLDNQIRDNVAYLLENGSSEIYYLPRFNYKENLVIKNEKPLPNGGLIYVKKRTDRTSSDQPKYFLVSRPQTQAALVSIDVRSGAIISLVGGFNYRNYKFNRATQAKRQPGSNFKPFLYAAALDKGFTAATIIDDIPVSFEDESTGFIWTPNNYSKKYFGPTRLREALTKSRNLVSVKLLNRIGVNYLIKHTRKFGFSLRPFLQNKNLSLALGSAPLTPLEMVRGYAVFANGGHLVTPYLIARIEDRNGQIIYQHEPQILCYQKCESWDKHQPPQTLDKDTGYIISDILKDVILYGTGRKAKVLKRKDIAGKTGTTNEQFDAWFSGFNRSIATTVWVGYDDPQPMGDKETGAQFASPIWINYMREALKDTQIIDLPRSNNLVNIRISRKNGKPVVNNNNPQKTLLEIFRVQYAPVYEGDQNGKTKNKLPPSKTSDDNTESLIKKIF